MTITRHRMRDERGGVLALVAIMLPAFLVLAALVIDTGNWFTHKRQLQTRADAAAFAAGVEYSGTWMGCLSDDPVARAAAETAILNAAKQYAGDSTSTGTLYNTEITDQSKTSILYNSTSYDTFVSDGGGPCYKHTTGDDISAPGYWTDVKVKERDLFSLFGSIGLPLTRNIARARVEIRPAISDNGFIPLAVPEYKIEKAQVRYVAYCDGFGGAGTVIGKTYLSQLQQPYQTNATTTYWGPAVNGSEADPNATVAPAGLTINVPAKTCGSYDFVPITVEVRVSGRAGLDIDTPSCAALLAAQFTDCWSQVSTVRGWKTDNSPEARAVSVSGGACSPDPYFTRVANCNASVSIEVSYGSRTGTYRVEVEGQDMIRPGGSAGDTIAPNGAGSGVWTSQGTIGVSGAAGTASVLRAVLYWGCNSGGRQCQRKEIDVHRTFSASDQTAGSVDVVRTASAPQGPSQQLPSPYDNIAVADASVSSILVYPTLGLRSSLRTRQFRTLRVSDPNVNQSLNCNAGNQGSDFTMFLNGCTPFYGPNSFQTGFWWTPTNPPRTRCPDRQTIANAPNTPSDPWECSPMATGLQGSVIADGIAARTGNCANISSNGCSGHPVCVHPNRYADWVNGQGDPADPRIVKLFIVPYGSLKGLQAQDGVPILDFATFYITGWGGNGANADPCTGDVPNVGDPPDDTVNPSGQALGNGEIVGYFIEFVGPNVGPVDPNANCVIGQIRPCRAVLVR